MELKELMEKIRRECFDCGGICRIGENKDLKCPKCQSIYTGRISNMINSIVLTPQRDSLGLFLKLTRNKKVIKRDSPIEEKYYKPLKNTLRYRVYPYDVTLLKLLLFYLVVFKGVCGVYFKGLTASAGGKYVGTKVYNPTMIKRLKWKK